MITHPVLAIDYGDSRIGVACTDALGIAVHPLATLLNKSAFHEVSSLIKSRQVSHLVMGLPLLKDGTEGSSAEKARAFADLLSQAFPTLSIDFIDESFSTVDAASKLQQAGLNTKKQKNIIDQVAAMEILHRFLELHGCSMRS